MNSLFLLLGTSIALLSFNVCVYAQQIVRVDGSSTVFRLSEAAAEDFLKQDSKVRVTVGISGTGGGFKKFCSNETDISNASRPIKESELTVCAKNGVEFIEIPVAYDALSVVINKKNDWVDSLTVDELRMAWEPAAQEKITSWRQIRASWPDRPLKLFGAGVDSGTYDYFTEAIMGKEDQSRGDYTSSEDDNVIVQGVASDTGAMGFFGLAYYEENSDRLKVVPIDDKNDTNGAGPVIPNEASVLDGSYQPLARPLFIYVRKSSLDRVEVLNFLKFYLEQMSQLASEVGYVPLTSKVLELTKARVENRITGTIFKNHGSQVGVKLEELLAVP